MLTGKALGQAIAAAIEKKRVTKVAVAQHFHVKPPSIQDWINKGTIDKAKLPPPWPILVGAAEIRHYLLTRD